MSILREFFVKLGLDLEGEQFAKAELAVAGVKLGLEKLNEVGHELVHAIPEMVERMSEQAEGLEHMSQRTGVSVEALQELGYAARFAGLSQEEMGFSLQRLARSMAHASGGSKEIAAAFTKLHIQSKGVDGKLRDVNDVVYDLADAFKKMPDGAEKTALVMELFGRSGAQMIPLLNKGSQGFKELADEGRDFGVVLDETTIKAGVHFVEANKRMHAAIEGVKNTIAGPFIEGMAKTRDKIADWIKDNRELVKTIADKAFTVFAGVMRIIGAVVFVVYRVVSRLVDIIGRLIDYFYKAGPVIGTITTALAAVLVAIMIFGSASVAAALTSAAAWILAALPIIAVGALIAVAILLVEDLYTGLTGGKSVLFELWATWKKFLAEWLEDKDDDPWWLSMVKMLLRFILDTPAAWNQVIDAWKQIFSDFVEWVEGLFAGMWAGIKKAAVSALDSINPFSNPFEGPGAPRASTTSYTPRVGSTTTISPSTHIGSLTVQTTGDPNDVVSKVRKTIDEHHEYVMRTTKAALAGNH